jgi:hypothetical protein
MLRGVGGWNWDSGAGAAAGFQASTYPDDEESTTVDVVEAATRADVVVSSDYPKSDTSRFSPISITQGCICK